MNRDRRISQLCSDGSDDDKYRGCHKVDVMVVVNQTPKNRATFMAQTMADFTSIMEERVGVDFASLAEGMTGCGTDNCLLSDVFVVYISHLLDLFLLSVVLSCMLI